MCPATLLMFQLLYKHNGLSPVPTTHINSSAVSNMNCTSSSFWVGMLVLFWKVLELYRAGPSKRKDATTGLILKVTHALWSYSLCSAQLGELLCPAIPSPLRWIDTSESWANIFLLFKFGQLTNTIPTARFPNEVRIKMIIANWADDVAPLMESLPTTYESWAIFPALHKLGIMGA